MGVLLFDNDGDLGMRRTWRADPLNPSKITVATEQDVTDIVEDTKTRFNMFDERSRWGGDGAQQHKVASIPLGLYMQLWREGVAQDQTAFRKWLNDRDNRVFRTRPGRV